MIVKTWKVPGVKTAAPNERMLKVIFSPEVNGKHGLTYLVSIIMPGGATGEHSHEVDEYMYVAYGRGAAFNEDREVEISQDMVIHAPSNTKHGVKNTGEETLKLICVFIPPLSPSGYFKEATKVASEYFKRKE
jgi:mannose-6-phosphate isomerase-like protein (cupin superfamily)